MNTEIKWVPLADVVAALGKLDYSSWTRDMDLKYIGIRVDTRDNHCFLTDREGKPIDIKRIESAAELGRLGK